MILLQDKYN